MGVGAFPSDRTWVFPVGDAVLWDILGTTDDYTRWWPWLHRFDAGSGLTAGARWTCVVAPPLPYTVKFHLVLERVEPGRLVEASVSGDLSGTAQLTIDGGKTASTVRLVSQLRPTNVVMRAFAAVARPAVEFGHGWILEQGRRQFVERALPE